MLLLRGGCRDWKRCDMGNPNDAQKEVLVEQICARDRVCVWV